MSEIIQLYDAHGRRLYLSAAERDAFLDAATHADRPLRTLCSVLYYTGCRISEALALIPRRIDLHDQTIISLSSGMASNPTRRVSCLSR